MNSIIEKYRSLDFGPVKIDEGSEPYLLKKDLNGEITLLCRSLPPSQQAPALIFLMRYAGISIGDEMDIFRNYYAPAWTILMHLGKKTGKTGNFNFPPLRRSLAMAMFLHSLEDHMTDEEISTDMLTLLIHGEAYHRYRAGLKEIEGEVEGAPEVTALHLDRYYRSIASPPKEESIEGYCGHFREEMATWTLPVLLTAMAAAPDLPVDAIQEAYECFGIAWRLLDDLNDIGSDIADGTRSACYYMLAQPWRQLYDMQEEPRDRHEILKHLESTGALEGLRALTCGYLDRGAEAARKAHLDGYAEELALLAAPLRSAPEK